MITNGASLKAKRSAAGIAGHLLCMKAGIARTRLSDIERSYATPSPEELTRLNNALDELIRAKQAIQQTAIDVGWPVAEVHAG